MSLDSPFPLSSSVLKGGGQGAANSTTWHLINYWMNYAYLGSRITRDEMGGDQAYKLSFFYFFSI